MKLFFMIYSFTMIMSIFNLKIPKKPTLLSNNKNNLYYIIFICFSLIFFAGCRKGFVDTSTYKKMCESVGTTFSNAFNGTLPTEKGFNLLMIISNNLINNSQFFIFISTCITFCLIFYKIYTTSIDKSYSAMLFLFLCFYTFINGIRQAIVASIFFCFFDKYKDNNRILIISCLLLSFIHLSALFLIPLVICSQGEVFNKKIKILYLIVIVSILSPNIVVNIVNMMGNERYMDSLNIATKGVNIFRIFVNSVPLLMSLFYIKYIKNIKKLNIEEKRMVNILLIDFSIYILSINSVYFARIEMYFSLFGLIYMPYLLKKIFDSKSYLLIRYISILFYSIYFFYQTYTFYNYGYLKDFYLFL